MGFCTPKRYFFKYRLAKPTTQYVDIHQNLSKVELKTQNQETQIKMGHHYRIYQNSFAQMAGWFEFLELPLNQGE